MRPVVLELVESRLKRAGFVEAVDRVVVPVVEGRWALAPTLETEFRNWYKI